MFSLYSDNQNQSKSRMNEKIVAFDLDNLSNLIRSVSDYSDAAFDYNLIIIEESERDIEELDASVLEAKKEYLNKRQNVISYLNPLNKYAENFQNDLNEMDKKLESIWSDKDNKFTFNDEMNKKYIQEEKRKILLKVK